MLLTDGLGQHREALECLKRALELEPDCIVIKQNIRNVEHQLKSYLGMLLLLKVIGGLVLVVGAVILICIWGSRSEPARPQPTASEARAKLKTVLDSWAQGELWEVIERNHDIGALALSINEF